MLRKFFDIVFNIVFGPGGGLIVDDEKLCLESIRLFSPDLGERRKALIFFLRRDVLFPEPGAIDSERTFFVIDRISSLVFDDNKALYMEAVELFFEVLTNDAYDLEHDGESVKVIVKRKLSPFIEKMKVLQDQHHDDLIPDLRALLYWLERPIKEWEDDPPWLDWPAVARCQKMRDST